MRLKGRSNGGRTQLTVIDIAEIIVAVTRIIIVITVTGIINAS